MALPPEKRLKYLTYDGFHPPVTQATVAYMIQGNRVMFSATENVVIKTSTINASPEIIRLICEAEGLNWREYEFYDLQTKIGYPHHEVGYYSLDQVVVENDNYQVKSWIEVASSRIDEEESLKSHIQQVMRLLEAG
jgi:hypothetical protein